MTGNKNIYKMNLNLMHGMHYEISSLLVWVKIHISLYIMRKHDQPFIQSLEKSAVQYLSHFGSVRMRKFYLFIIDDLVIHFDSNLAFYVTYWWWHLLETWIMLLCNSQGPIPTTSIFILRSGPLCSMTFLISQPEAWSSPRYLILDWPWTITSLLNSPFVLFCHSLLGILELCLLTGEQSAESTERVVCTFLWHL